MVEVILISQLPLPYNKIGSWTTLYSNYLSSDISQIDTVICEEPKTKFEGVNYQIVKQDFSSKLKKKLHKKPQYIYLQTLLNYLEKDKFYILQIVDNFGFAKALYAEINESSELRERLYIQFFYHGHDPFYGNFESRWFYEFIDEMVLLTEASYIKHRDYYSILPCRFSILHNGIDTTKFFKIADLEKSKLKTEFGVAEKTVFIWCSRDTPKKGLDFILQVWKQVYQPEKDMVLWVIGSTREIGVAGVQSFGRIPNNELPKYFQVADCYLFPTLCQEGFGLSLVEALHCGCYAIASALGGVPEVLDFGRFGRLIGKPHMISEWTAEIIQYMEMRPGSNFDNNRYTSGFWNLEMNKRINGASFIE